MDSANAYRYAEFLARNGWRAVQDDPVVEAVFAMHGPFNGAALAAKVEGKASRVTVYRTLTRLAEAGHILPVEFNRQPAFVVASLE
jgi:Fe2+ or Zn2+ uptake regulation protein